MSGEMARLLIDGGAAITLPAAIALGAPIKSSGLSARTRRFSGRPTTANGRGSSCMRAAGHRGA